MDDTLSLDYQQTDFGREIFDEVERLDGRIDDEIVARSDADDNLQNQIDAIKASSDVVDVVGTYAELEAYDTTKLNDNDIVKVLEDETHDGDITYYRWSTSTEAFSFVGSLAAYYNKGETDTLLRGKQDVLTAGTNIQINDNVISATGTTYTAGSNITINDNVISADKDAITLYAKPQTGHPNRYNFYYEDTFTTMVTRAEMLNMLHAGNVQITRTVRPGMSWTWAIYDVLEDGESTPDTIWFATSNFNIANPGFVSFSWRNGDDYATYNQFNVYSYSDFTGATSSTAGSHGLVPAPTTSDVDKYLKGDGTWGAISASTVTLYSGTGQSTDGAMTQKAVTDSLFANNDVTRVQIGGNGLGASVSNTIAIGSGGSSATKAYSTMIGTGGVTASGERSTAIGNQGIFASGFASTAIGSSSLQASGEGSVAIGYGGVTASHTQSIALGGYSTTGRAYELSLGQDASGQNPEKTRYIAHVTAGVNDTDAVNKKQLDDAIAGVPAANDATLTITQNGVSAGTFTANSATDTTIALTDTTYSAFTGTDGQTAGTAGLVPAPATTDAGKFLKADGTWDTAGGGTLYSDFGQNTDGAMTQKAVTDGIYSDYTNGKIRIGNYGLTSSGTRAIAIGSNGSGATGDYGVMIGTNGAQASGQYSIAIGSSGLYATALGAIAIGYGSRASAFGSIVIGYGGATAEYNQSIALGGISTTGRAFELSLGQNASGQTPETTRYIAHVTAGVNDTDAVNKKQLDDAIASIPAANNISSGDWSTLWQ